MQRMAGWSVRLVVGRHFDRRHIAFTGALAFAGCGALSVGGAAVAARSDRHANRQANSNEAGILDIRGIVLGWGIGGTYLCGYMHLVSASGNRQVNG